MKKRALTLHPLTFEEALAALAATGRAARPQGKVKPPRPRTKKDSAGAPDRKRRRD